MYQSIDLHTSSLILKRLLPKSVIEKIDFSTIRIPVLGLNIYGYRIATSIFYSRILEKVSDSVAKKVQNYRQKQKERFWQTVSFDECDDVMA